MCRRGPLGLLLGSVFAFLDHPGPAVIYPLPLHDALPISSTNTTADGSSSSRSNISARRLACRSAPKRLAEMFDRLLRSEEHTSELQSRFDLVCRLLLEKKKYCAKGATAWTPFTMTAGDTA